LRQRHSATAAGRPVADFTWGLTPCPSGSIIVAVPAKVSGSRSKEQDGVA
jgi:hypothetical protein